MQNKKYQDKKYRDLLLDADETLFDFSACEKKAFFESAESLQFPADEELYAKYTLINDRLWKAHERGEIEREEILKHRYADLLESVGRDPKDGIRWNLAYEEALSHQAILFDDTASACEKLAKSYRLSIITNGLAHVQHGRISKSGIADYFSEIFISEEIGYSKPSIHFFEAVEKALPDFEKNYALVIGDSLTGDIEGANRFGMDCVLMDRKNQQEDQSDRYLYRVTSMESLVQFLLLQ